MGVWDQYCLICGVTASSMQYIYRSDEIVRAQCESKNYKWLKNILIITNMEKIIETSSENYNNYGGYTVGKTTYNVSPVGWHLVSEPSEILNDKYGIACHKNCYSLLKDKLNYKLRFGDVCKFLDPITGILKSGYIAKYIRQDFPVIEVLGELPWIMENPLSNRKNSARICKIWKPLIKKIKSTPPKDYPAESAENFKSGTLMYGRDRKLWVVKGKKWHLKV